MEQRAPDDENGLAAADEYDRLAADLRYATRSHDWIPSPQLVTAIVEWRVRAVAAARTNLWVAGMAGSQDPRVEEVLRRFHVSHAATAIRRVNHENRRLKLGLLRALACIRHYAGGVDDGGARAADELRNLLASEQDVRDANVIRGVFVPAPPQATGRPAD